MPWNRATTKVPGSRLPRFTYVVFCDHGASEAGLLLVVKLRRNVVMMCAGLKQCIKLRQLNYRIKNEKMESQVKAIDGNRQIGAMKRTEQ